MKATEIRKAFIQFFESKQHTFVKPSPVVNRNDPTLMFTNAGMNQFKDAFLGNQTLGFNRAVNSQPCLRVTGKHNDLEDVGKDTYHHTLFEMLGNWSFGNYFKSDALPWTWEFLTEVVQLPKDRLYVTIFGGDENDGLAADEDSFNIWKKIIPEDRILRCNKKDNFWEMGATGPCGPCSEIHFDNRSDEERAKGDGAQWVNNDHPLVIEIWNNVFMEFNRLADGSLEKLPAQHVDTGMGLERLVRILQNKTSNYDTDIFMPIIQELERRSGLQYGHDEKVDIAMRVAADHIRAVTFIISDGTLPSNNKAGYVCRRILRRAVRYGYSFLGLHAPYMHSLVPMVASYFVDLYPSIENQKDFIARIILEEENAFLRTLSNGLKRMEQYFEAGNVSMIDGAFAFELYDTFGFPIDLTNLIASEKGITLDEAGFQKELDAQRARSKADAVVGQGDWNMVSDEIKVQFVGYDTLDTQAHIVKYRTQTIKDKPVYHIVLDVTPFYAESGGQLGDKGWLKSDTETLTVLDTKKENDLIIHIVDQLPINSNVTFTAQVNPTRRAGTSAHHSATHLLHAALRHHLGKHVEQKGSLVGPDRLRFDFSHFEKVSDDLLKTIADEVNAQILAAIPLEEKRSVPFDEAVKAGAMALFGEKYGNEVRVITFDPKYSVELCGGTHVANTRDIRLFQIVSEGSVAAGVRRIEAVTHDAATQRLMEKAELADKMMAELRLPKDPIQAIQSLFSEQKSLQNEVALLQNNLSELMKNNLLPKAKLVSFGQMIYQKIDFNHVPFAKNMVQSMIQSHTNLMVILHACDEQKVQVVVGCGTETGFQANQLIKSWSPMLQGGGGGTPQLANAGGKNIHYLAELNNEVEHLGKKS
jgi:alanyl-tRNA synthetase